MDTRDELIWDIDHNHYYYDIDKLLDIIRKDSRVNVDVLWHIASRYTWSPEVVESVCAHPDLSEDVLDRIIKEMVNIFNKGIDDVSRHEVIFSKLVNHPMFNRKMFLYCWNHLELDSVYKHLFSSSQITSDDLLQCSLKRLVDGIPSTVTFADEIVKSKALDEQTLITLLQNCIVPKFYLAVANSDLCTKDIMLDTMFPRIRSWKKEQIGAFITTYMENKNCTKDIIKIVLDDCELDSISYDYILNSSFADGSIKARIYILTNQFFGKQQIDTFLGFDGVGPSEISFLLVRAGDKFVIEQLLDKASSIMSPSNYRSIAELIIDSPNIDLVDKLLEKCSSEDVLVTLVSDASSILQTIDKVVDNPNADMAVVHRIYNTSFEMDDLDARIVQQKADRLKRRITGQMFIVEEEENPTEMLRINVEEGIATMLWGPSGVGKTARVMEIDPTATMLTLKNGQIPEEIIGGKDPNGKPGEEFPPHWYTLLCDKCQQEPDRQHILFIDEITNVSDTIKNLVWEIVETKVVGRHEEWRLPENCAVVLAGNRPEESTAVRLDSAGGVMPAPLHNRVVSMIEIKFSIEEWSKWAMEINPKTGKQRIHPIVYSFCIANAEKVMFTNYDPNNVTEPFLSPRKWEHLSNMIYKAEERGKNHHVSYARLYSCIGENNISNAFIEHYERVPLDLSKVENGEYNENDFPNVEDKYYALGTLLAEEGLDPIAVEDFILTCLGDEYLSIYNNSKSQRKAVTESNGNNMKFTA